MNNRLLNLLKDNADRGAFRAQVTNEGATLYIYDVIVSDDWLGGVSAQAVIDALADIPQDQPVTLRINSPGGDVFAARAIESHIHDRKGKVTAIIDGIAASAASYIATAADEVQMQPGAFLMIHKAWTMAMGNSEDFVSTASLLEKIDGTLADTYARRSGGREATEFADLMAVESWLTAQEAIDLGLADSIKEVTTPEGAANSQWNLAAFGDKAPAIACPDGTCQCGDEQEGEQDHGLAEARMEALRREVELAEIA